LGSGGKSLSWKREIGWQKDNRSKKQNAKDTERGGCNNLSLSDLSVKKLISISAWEQGLRKKEERAVIRPTKSGGYSKRAETGKKIIDQPKGDELRAPREDGEQNLFRKERQPTAEDYEKDQ